MARTKTDKTAIQIAADNARKAYADAKEKHSKAATEPNKKAMDTAGEKMRAAVKAENRERFENVGGGRVAKAIAVIGTLKQVSNRRSYEYSETDVAKAFKAIRDEVNEAETLFKSALSSSGDKKAATGASKFQF